MPKSLSCQKTLWFAEMTTSWKQVFNQAMAPSLADAEPSEPSTGKGELQHLVQQRQSFMGDLLDANLDEFGMI